MSLPPGSPTGPPLSPPATPSRAGEGGGRASRWRTAGEWEYRWRAVPLFLSQAVVLGGQLAWQRSLDLPVALAPGLVAVCLAAAGLGARVWGTAILSAATMVSMRAQTDRLVTGGVFGLVRHPLYLGDILIFTAYTFLLNPWLAPVFALYHWARVERLIGYEDVRLRARWGEAYEAYARRVPRLVPRWRRVQPVALAWRDGLLGNAIWIGFLTGYVAAVRAGDLWALTPFETAGFLFAAVYFSRKAALASSRAIPEAPVAP